MQPVNAKLDARLIAAIEPLACTPRASAIDKQPARDRLRLGQTGFAGDEQAARKHHGGPDKAVIATRSITSRRERPESACATCSRGRAHSARTCRRAASSRATHASAPSARSAARRRRCRSRGSRAGSSTHASGSPKCPRAPGKAGERAGATAYSTKAGASTTASSRCASGRNGTLSSMLDVPYRRPPDAGTLEALSRIDALPPS
ncbi:putative mOSC domain protein [Burkholderia sp. ABCPW 111]|nr:putative mOSC domain protein [Burkholderia sp. ABCPW 111]